MQNKTTLECDSLGKSVYDLGSIKANVEAVMGRPMWRSLSVTGLADRFVLSAQVVLGLFSAPTGRRGYLFQKIGFAI